MILAEHNWNGPCLFESFAFDFCINLWYALQITYLSGFTYEEMVDTPDKKERRRRRRKPMHLINSAINNDRNMRDLKNPDLTIASNGGCRKGASHYPIEQPLIQVLREINNKITNQRRLWIDLDSWMPCIFDGGALAKPWTAGCWITQVQSRHEVRALSLVVA